MSFSSPTAKRISGSRPCTGRRAGLPRCARSPPMAEREAAIAGFLATAGWSRGERRKLAGDASFRRYERLVLDGKRAILMDAPPPQENVRPFLAVQDAVVGPASYDLVSLLEDARRDVPPALATVMIERYLAGFPGIDRVEFMASYAVLGAQRSSKIVGIFTRLWKRDGKPQYLGHLPRVWRLIEQDVRHPALAPVAVWLAHHAPPSSRLLLSERPYDRAD